jgi:cob(I)alamin adenosyltransferase
MRIADMDNKELPTVDDSLEGLSDALDRAADDLRSVQPAIEQARADIASRNTAVPRSIVRDAERVVNHLEQAEECLQDVLKDLADRE